MDRSTEILKKAHSKAAQVRLRAVQTQLKAAFDFWSTAKTAIVLARCSKAALSIFVMSGTTLLAGSHLIRMTPTQPNLLAQLLHSVADRKSAAKQHVAKARQLGAEVDLTIALSRELIKEARAATTRGRNRRLKKVSKA